MQCAGKGQGTRCTGPPTRRCARCEAVAYCSVSHQIQHWSVHKEECERLEEQMKLIDVLNDFPFTFSEEATLKVCEKQESRCSIFSKWGIHQVGMWLFECSCGASCCTSFLRTRSNDGWHLSGDLCPCSGPTSPISKRLSSWKDYYEWRSIPVHSPVAVLLHLPLTIYYAIQLAGMRGMIPETGSELHIHYLGPEKELCQLEAFGELHALFPDIQLDIELVGPAVPQCRDGERIDLHGFAHCVGIDCVCKNLVECTNCSMSAVTLWLRKGCYHERYVDMAKDFSPHIIIAPNAGIAAYSSWLPTLELIRDMNVPAIFSDYCEEASHLAASCISSITHKQPRIPVQLNPFRQPLAVEDSALLLPCYSNCFLFGM